MSQLIQDNEGCIDKYIGDAIMAIWNAPETVIDHPIKACETALLYQSRLGIINMGTRLFNPICLRLPAVCLAPCVCVYVV